MGSVLLLSVGTAAAAAAWGAASASAAEHAPPDEPAALFHRGVAALESGAYEDAIASFEALADRGFLHPDACFDRALAYLARVRAHAEQPGDLGRAAAALEETLAERPGDREAESALEQVRAEVARRRARVGRRGDVEAKPSLEQAIVGIASEQTWSIAALVASAILSLGLAARAASRRTAFHLAATIAIPLGSAALVLFAGLAFEARRLRHSADQAVVVVPDAYLTDERGRVAAQGPIPEAARVSIEGTLGDRVHVRWGAVEGWTPLASLRRLPRSSD